MSLASEEEQHRQTTRRINRIPIVRTLSCASIWPVSSWSGHNIALLCIILYFILSTHWHSFVLFRDFSFHTPFSSSDPSPLNTWGGQQKTNLSNTFYVQICSRSWNLFYGLCFAHCYVFAVVRWAGAHYSATCPHCVLLQKTHPVSWIGKRMNEWLVKEQNVPVSRLLSVTLDGWRHG